MITEHAAAEIVHGLRQMVDTNHQILAALRMTMPQWYGMKELARRWGIGRDAILRLAREHTGYRPQQGVALSITLDEVLRLDPLVAEMKRGAPARWGAA